MAAGLPDLVDCARLAEDGASLKRVYELAELPRLNDVLAAPGGALRARFAFAKSAAGRALAAVSIDASPQLVCQRCMQGFTWPVSGASAVEFAATDDADVAESEREYFRMQNGQVSLRDLAEEELLLALPIAPACSTPQSCGRAPSYTTGADGIAQTGESHRPFSGLQDLLKKT